MLEVAEVVVLVEGTVEVVEMVVEEETAEAVGLKGDGCNKLCCLLRIYELYQLSILY